MAPALIRVPELLSKKSKDSHAVISEDRRKKQSLDLSEEDLELIRWMNSLKIPNAKISELDVKSRPSGKELALFLSTKVS
jgi:hypothetical protein